MGYYLTQFAFALLIFMASFEKGISVILIWPMILLPFFVWSMFWGSTAKNNPKIRIWTGLPVALCAFVATISFPTPLGDDMAQSPGGSHVVALLFGLVAVGLAVAGSYKLDKSKRSKQPAAKR